MRHQALQSTELLALRSAKGLGWPLVTIKSTGVVWSAVLQLLLGDLLQPMDLWHTYLCRHIIVLPDHLWATKITMSTELHVFLLILWCFPRG